MVSLSNQFSGRRGQRNSRLAAGLLALCLLGAGGCRVVKETAKLPVKTVQAVVPGTQAKVPDPALVQAELLRYADDFFGRVASGLDEYARRVNTAQGRTEALNWKLALTSSALGIATGSNPTASLLDFLAISSLTRAFLELHVGEVERPDALGPLLDSSRILETNAWKLAEGLLSPEQQKEFRAAIERWLAANKTQRGFFRRPQELATGIRLQGEKESQPGSVFSLVGLDPTAGLDPAVREMTRTRLFAERTMFTLQRMPFLLRWQTESLVDQLLRQEQLTNALATAERLSHAAESASQTAALLPDRVTNERMALLDALDTQEGRLRELSAEVGRTLTAADKMSTSLNTTLITFDALMKRFGVGEPKTSPPNTNAAPFNILDYARTAEQIAVVANQLDALLKDANGTLDAPALDKRIAQLSLVSEQARADAKSVLNHAFLLAAGLVVLAFACALVYRRLGNRKAVTDEATDPVLH